MHTSLFPARALVWALFAPGTFPGFGGHAGESALPDAVAIDRALVPSRAGTGFYRVEERDGRWWFMDPAGEPTLSKGVCHITFAGDSIQRTGRSPYRDAVQARHGDAERWRQVAATRLLDWGFNSLGAWSDPRLVEIEVHGRRLADAPIVDFGSRFVATTTPGGQAWLQGIFPDVFDPRFESFCQELARDRCAPRKDDPTILGWFTDNELRWGPDWRGQGELLTLFLNLPANAPGRAAAIDLLRRRHSGLAGFNRIWKTDFVSWDDLARVERMEAPFIRKAIYAQNEGEERQANEADPDRAVFVADCEAFAGLVAERYFRITREALRAADPNHLNFGARFAYVPPPPVRASAAAHLDVISFNCYQTDPTSVVRQYAVLGRPMIIGEFTFRADDVGLPNTRGAGPRVPTQVARAEAFERYVQLLLAEPLVIGYHWFQHNDQPKEGRFDGENSNYGVVNETDDVYPELTRTMTAVNAVAERWHAAPHRGGFLDPFVGGLREGWWWIREDASAWRFTPHGLQIRVQPGNMWGPANNARNLLVRPAPDPAQHTVTVSVTVSNRPTEQYEQVNLVWYYDDGHMVKIGQEQVDGRLSLVMGREENDRTRTICIIPIEAERVDLRLAVRGAELIGEFRPAHTPEWLKAGSCTLPVQGRPHITLQAYQGPAQTERWATFSNFRIESDEPPPSHR
jgi:regulation of enolase protein 1 (concanavalin A-like superfamily)